MTNSELCTSIIVRAGNYTHFIRICEIEFIEVAGSRSILIHTDFNQKIRVYKTLTKFLLAENLEALVQVHRKYAVHKCKVSYIDHEDRRVYLQGSKSGIDIGEKYLPCNYGYLKLKFRQILFQELLMTHYP